MGYELLIAIRHLRARRRGSLSIVSWLAIIGVALGVMALVGGFGVTQGFEDAFRKRILSFTAHVMVREYGVTFDSYRHVEELIWQHDGVKATAPMTFNEVLVSGRGGTTGAVVKGIVPDRVEQIMAISEHIESGDLADLGKRGQDGLDGVVLGASLAARLDAKSGDVVTVVSPLRDLDPDEWQARARTPTTRNFRVVGIFRAGFHRFDSRLLYMELSVAQAFFYSGDSVRAIEVAATDPADAPRLADDLQQELGTAGFSVVDWQRQNRNLFQSLTYQRLAILIVLSVMIVLASCNVACILIMIVLERSREIAILKAMGAGDFGVLRIFLFQGLALGLIGTVIGLVGGWAFCELLLARGIELDPKVYAIARLPIVVGGIDYLVCAIGAMLITLVATLFPAWMGARLRPVDGLRETNR